MDNSFSSFSIAFVGRHVVLKQDSVPVLRVNLRAQNFLFCLQCADLFCLQCADLFCLQCADLFCLQCADLF